MEYYNEIIKSLNFSFIKLKNIKLLKSVNVKNFYSTENTILFLNNCKVTFLKNNKKNILKNKDILFIPSEKLVSITYGNNCNSFLTNEYFINNHWKYFESINNLNDNFKFENFSYITFDVKLFNSINFFNLLDISPFIIKNNINIKNIFNNILNEIKGNKIGKEKILKINIEYLTIEIIRCIANNNLFTKKFENNICFQDIRLFDIFTYIKYNINNDLSNKIIAYICNISEDYVGQYFKMKTGINLQDYIEYQRIEHAIELMLKTKKSIKEIGICAGYKNTSYFCKRFKIMFGISPNKVKKKLL